MSNTSSHSGEDSLWTNPFGVLNELSQAGILLSCSYHDLGPVGHQWGALVKVSGRNGLQIDNCALGSSKKEAKRQAAACVYQEYEAQEYQAAKARRSVICRPEYTTKQLKCIALAAEHLSRLRCLQLEGGPTVVSIDVEAWERDGSKITEVGVAHLSGSGYILTRHFIIKEHEHLRNGIFVADNKYQFNSGGSEIISLEQVSSKLEGIYSSLHEPVTVGHSIHGDLKWLKGMGVYLDGRKAVDIALARQALDGKLESTSLVRMLEDLGIPYCNLHNAGNDARYTLQALIAMCASAGGCRIAPPTVRWGVWYVLQDHSWISRAN